MKRHLIWGIMLLSTFAYAQSNYTPATLVLSNGDTLKGEVNYAAWEYNPKKISFKEKDTPTDFKPTEVKTILIDGQVYVGAVVQIETSSHQLNNLSASITPNFGKDTVFLKQLIGGTKSLYLYKERQGRDFFYIGDNYELLVYKEYSKNGAILKNQTYANQLSTYLQDCSSMMSKVSNIKYKVADLTALFAYYYSCVNSKPTFQPKADKAVFTLFAITGASLTSLNFKNTDPENKTYLTAPNFSWSPRPVIGIGFNLASKKLSKTAFRTELNYTSYNTSAEYKRNFTYFGKPAYEIITSRFKFSYLKLMPMFRLNIMQKSNSTVFTNIGVGYGLALKSSTQKDSYVYVNDTATENSTRELFDEYSKSEISAHAGVGFSLKKISFECRYERGNAMSKSKELISRSHRLAVLVAYSLSK